MYTVTIRRDVQIRIYVSKNGLELVKSIVRVLIFFWGAWGDSEVVW